MFVRGKLLKGIVINKIDVDEKKLFIKGSDYPISIEDISRIFVSKQVGKQIMEGYPSIIHFYDKFKRKNIFIDMFERGKLKSIRTNFLSMFRYQIITEGKNNIGLMYKIHMSSFSFLKPYPENLIEYTNDTENWKAGEWRKDFEMIKEIFDEEMQDGEEYLVYLALKDGRNIKGITKKGFIFESLTRLFSTSRKESIFLLNHAIADVLDISPAPL